MSVALTENESYFVFWEGFPDEYEVFEYFNDFIDSEDI